MYMGRPEEEAMAGEGGREGRGKARGSEQGKEAMAIVNPEPLDKVVRQEERAQVSNEGNRKTNVGGRVRTRGFESRKQPHQC
jgi:hypothetical protein